MKIWSPWFVYVTAGLVSVAFCEFAKYLFGSLGFGVTAALATIAGVGVAILWHRIKDHQ